MTSSVTAATDTGATPQTNTNAAQETGIDKLADKETFLKLLVAQIRNQNPLNPADGTQFVTQLAQFSELEQVIQIRSDLEQITKAANPDATAGAA